MPGRLPEVPIDGNVKPQARRLAVDTRRQTAKLIETKAPPQVPTNLKATAQPFANLIQWTTSADADYYEILIGATANIALATATNVGRSSQWYDTVGTAGILRFYWVRARKNNGAQSNPAGAVSATTGGTSGNTTGSGAVVLQNSPTINTPTINGGAGNLSLPKAVTGSGNVVEAGSPTISNPTFTGTGISFAAPWGFTEKTGSGSGVDYQHSGDTLYTDVDTTNLAFTVTIPTGWKLAVWAYGSITSDTNPQFVLAGIFDGSIVREVGINPSAAGQFSPFSLHHVITGDGASHTVKLQYRTTNAANGVHMRNVSATEDPAMIFLLLPSN